MTKTTDAPSENSTVKISGILNAISALLLLAGAVGLALSFVMDINGVAVGIVGVGAGLFVHGIDAFLDKIWPGYLSAKHLD